MKILSVKVKVKISFVKTIIKILCKGISRGGGEEREGGGGEGKGSRSPTGLAGHSISCQYLPPPPHPDFLCLGAKSVRGGFIIGGGLTTIS